jgi:hypothetical protein
MYSSFSLYGGWGRDGGALGLFPVIEPGQRRGPVILGNN